MNEENRTDENQQAEEQTSWAEDFKETFKELTEEGTKEPEKVEETVTEEKTPEETSASEETAKTEETASNDKIAAPSEWSEQEREAFNKAPDDLKKILHDRYRSQQADYTRKTQEIAASRKKYEALDSTLEPYRKDFALRGVDEVTAIKQLLAVRDDINANPVEAIRRLAERCNVSLETLVQQGDEYVDPQIAELRRENEALKQNFNGLTGTIQQQQQQSLSALVASFAQEVDATGAKKHQFFDDVIDDMKPYLRQARSQDEARQIIADAYEKAVWTNPITREKVIQAKTRENLLKQQQAERDKAKKAETASRTVSPGSHEGGTKRGDDSGSWKDAFAATAEEIGFRR